MPSDKYRIEITVLGPRRDTMEESLADAEIMAESIQRTFPGSEIAEVRNGLAWRGKPPGSEVLRRKAIA